MPPLTPPPLPIVRRPRLAVPPGAIDCHVHLFGPSGHFPFADGSRYASADCLPETQIAMQDMLGFSRAALVSGGAYGTDTRHLEHVLARHGDRFLGVALVGDEATAADIARLDRLGVRAVRFVSPAHGGRLPPLSMRTARLAADAGWHVQYYPFRAELADREAELGALPCDLVLDHFAHIPAALGTTQPAFSALLRLLDTGRIWVKLSGPMRISDEEPPYPAVIPLARALAAHCPERLVWASDWPHVNMAARTMPDDADLVDLIADWVPDAAARKAILEANPRQLFRL